MKQLGLALQNYTSGRNLPARGAGNTSWEPGTIHLPFIEQAAIGNAFNFQGTTPHPPRRPRTHLFRGAERHVGAG